MSWNRESGITAASSDERGLGDLIDRQRLDGLAAILVGTSQVLLGMTGFGSSGWSGLTMSSWSIFLLGGGGWLLIGIGINLFQGRGAFESGWGLGLESERLVWLGTVTTFVIAVFFAAGAVWVLFASST
jgi:hypothetical protein